MQFNLTDQFINRLQSIESKTIPDIVLHDSKRCFIDYLGAAFAGQALLHEKTKMLADILGAIDARSLVVGSSRLIDKSNAIFLNGIHSHYVELDDGVIAGIIHPGTPIFSALLPWSEEPGVYGEDFLRGVVMGYESSVRLAETIQPAHKASGYHATATCGSVGAAWAICSMLGYTKEVKKHAFSAVTSRAGGSLKVLEDGSHLKPVNSGNAALLGHNSVALAKAGFAGPNDALLGQNGFLNLMTTKYDEQRLLREDTTYCIENTYFKPYAACRYCHPAIEAAIQIRTRESLDFSEIETITVSTYELAVAKHDHHEITGVSSAKMSIPISVAVAFVTGKAGIEEFSSSVLARPEIQELARKVKAQSSVEYTEAFPSKSPASLDIKLKGGRQIQHLVEFPKGEPDYPLSDRELSQKFQELAVFSGISLLQAEEIVGRVWDLPNNFNQLMPLLRGIN